MTPIPSIADLKAVLHDDEVVHPSFSVEAAAALGIAKEVIESVGLPIHIGDWYNAAVAIVMETNPREFRYTVDRVAHVAADAVRIGVFFEGNMVLDPKTGCIVHVEWEGITQLINTSIERFLYFAGRFRRSADRGFKDIKQVRRDFKKLDPTPLSDVEGAWSVMLEEAEEGIYG